MQRRHQGWLSVSTTAVTRLVCMVCVCRSGQPLSADARHNGVSTLGVDVSGASRSYFNANVSFDVEIVTSQRALLSGAREISITPQTQSNLSSINNHRVVDENNNGSNTLADISFTNREEFDRSSWRSTLHAPLSRSYLEVKFLSPTQGKFFLCVGKSL